MATNSVFVLVPKSKLDSLGRPFRLTHQELRGIAAASSSRAKGEPVYIFKYIESVDGMPPKADEAKGE